MSTSETRNDAARENARQADGKFGTYAQPKGTANLHLVAAGTSDAPEFDLAPAGRKDGFGGEVSVGTWTDARGVDYALTFSANSLGVDATDSGYDVRGWRIRGTFGPNGRFTEQDLRDLLDEAQHDISDRRGFEQAALRWLGQTRGQAALVDAYSGAISHPEGYDDRGGVKISGFSRSFADTDDYGGRGNNAALDRPAMVVTLADPSMKDGVAYTVTGTAADGVKIYRGQESLPLAEWEVEALNTEVARRLGEATVGPNLPSLRALLVASATAATEEDASLS